MHPTISYGCTARFVLDLVGNPEYRVSYNVIGLTLTHFTARSNIIAKVFVKEKVNGFVFNFRKYCSL